METTKKSKGTRRVAKFRPGDSWIKNKSIFEEVAKDPLATNVSTTNAAAIKKVPLFDDEISYNESLEDVFNPKKKKFAPKSLQFVATDTNPLSSDVDLTTNTDFLPQYKPSAVNLGSSDDDDNIIDEEVEKISFKSKNKLKEGNEIFGLISRPSRKTLEPTVNLQIKDQVRYDSPWYYNRCSSTDYTNAISNPYKGMQFYRTCCKPEWKQKLSETRKTRCTGIYNKHKDNKTLNFEGGRRKRRSSRKRKHTKKRRSYKRVYSRRQRY